MMCFAALSFGDTIRLKDGTVLHGEVIGFRDQQFTVLLGTNARGRRSRITLYMEDVESIEFDANASGAAIDSSATSDTNSRAGTIAPVDSNRAGSTVSETNASSASSGRVPPPRASGSPTFFQINTRVRADNTSNGWTNSGLVVRRGQRLRINASGRVSLGQGRYSTPAGLPSLADKDKLMHTEPTGGLIAVIGDNNDDFIFVGRSLEFTSQRDGVLFLGVNEGNLSDNSGAYDVVIEAEATSGSSAATP
jgi:hypothetical protein